MAEKRKSNIELDCVSSLFTPNLQGFEWKRPLVSRRRTWRSLFFKNDFDSRNQNGGTTEEWWERQAAVRPAVLENTGGRSPLEDPKNYSL